jgi:hypothetical protein
MNTIVHMEDTVDGRRMGGGWEENGRRVSTVVSRR